MMAALYNEMEKFKEHKYKLKGIIISKNKIF